MLDTAGIEFELILRLAGSRDLDFWRSGARHGEFWRSHQCLWSTQMDGKKSLNGIKTRSGNTGYHNKIVVELILQLISFEAFVPWRSGARHGEY